MQLLIVVEVAETEWHLDEVTGMRGSESQRWPGAAEWWHHHNDGSYLRRGRSKEQIFGMSTLRSCASNLWGRRLYLDCGSVSLLSFSSSSEISVSRTSGLDLFPYLRCPKHKTNRWWTGFKSVGRQYICVGMTNKTQENKAEINQMQKQTNKKKLNNSSLSLECV